MLLIYFKIENQTKVVYFFKSYHFLFVKYPYLWEANLTIRHINFMMKRLSGLLVLILFSICGYSQTLEDAKTLYLKGEYAKALPAFEKAIKTSPNNSSYNQWYGNTLLETGKIDNAEKYLKFAASKNVKEAFASLGKLYFLQYRFKESEEAYDKYLVFLKKEIYSLVDK